MKNEILEILAELEDFRLRVEQGKAGTGSPDWIIRMCQAKVAHGYFARRNVWIDELNEKGMIT